MVDIKIHNNERNRLASIKGVNDDFSGRLYAFDLFRNLIELSDCVSVCVRRNNYIISCLEQLKVLGQELRVHDLAASNDLFEISFYFDKGKAGDELLSILVDLWFAFQQPTFFLYLQKKDSSIISNHKMTHKQSWEEISDTFTSYVVFKGAEEDVIWIGRSETLKFEMKDLRI